METVIIAVIIFGAMLGLLLYFAKKQEDKKIYVYKNRKYYLYGKASMFLDNSLWVNACIYIDLSTGKTYVREEDDFLVKFKTLKEWENGRNDKGSRGKNACSIT